MNLIYNSETFFLSKNTMIIDKLLNFKINKKIKEKYILEEISNENIFFELENYLNVKINQIRMKSIAKKILNMI